MALPVLVGGITLPDRDFIPSFLFTVTYGLLTFTYIYRLIRKDSRTTITLGFLAFVIERTISFSLRTAVSHNPGTESAGLTEYMQATFGIAYIVPLQDLAKIHRFLLVSTTNPPKTNSSSKSSQLDTKRSASSVTLTEDIIQYDDDARTRTFFRRFDVFLNAVLPLATVCGALGCESIFKTGSTVHWVRLRFASTIIVLLVNLSMISLFVSRMKTHTFPNISRRAAYFLLILNGLLLSPAVYRLAVLGETTDDYKDPNAAMNSSLSKALFYTFHHLPEAITCILVASINIKDVFNIGMYGDSPPKPCRWRKKKQAEKEKSEKEKEKEIHDEKCNVLV